MVDSSARFSGSGGSASGSRKFADPGKVASLLLAIAVLTLGFADYWAYSVSYHQVPDIFQDLLHGTGLAPQQYRVGVLQLANLMAHRPLALRHTLTMIDVVAAFIGVFTLFFLLRRSQAYQQADPVRRWFAAAAFLALVEFYFAWVLWYQRPETLANLALIALTLRLLTATGPSEPQGSKTMAIVTIAISELVLAALQGFVRADVAFALHVGIFFVCLTGSGEGLRLPRRAQAVISALAAALAAGIQYYLMHVRYPQANYGKTPPFQLLLNLTTPSEWISFLLFLVPYAWTVLTILRQRLRLPAPDVAMLAGSAAFFAMWVLLGRIEEVRIFLPFALAMAPVTVKLAMERIVPEQAG